MTKWERNLAIYDQLVDMNPNFKRKGKTVPYTSANGYMFSMLNKDGDLGIRLPKESGKIFMENHNTGSFKSHGAIMKEYVLIPDNLMRDLELLSHYLKESYSHVMSLVPK